jgi:hypothetical protein
MGYAQMIIDQVGETVTVTAKTQSVDEWGHETETQASTGTTTCSFQIMNGEEDEVKEGILEKGDAQLFFKPDDDFQAYFDMDSYNIYITYNSVDYKVYRLIKEPASIDSGHYEMHARRV